MIPDQISDHHPKTNELHIGIVYIQVIGSVRGGDSAADGGRAAVVRLCLGHGTGAAGDAHGSAGRELHAQEEQGTLGFEFEKEVALIDLQLAMRSMVK